VLARQGARRAARARGRRSDVRHAHRPRFVSRADARARGNLALVLALEGKAAKAEEVGRKDLPAEAAAADAREITGIVDKSTASSSTKPATTLAYTRE